LRFTGSAYRAHNPRWSFSPLSGAGAAVHGGRFNPKGVPALYLGLEIMTAIREAQQGLPRKVDPLVLCSYEIDCNDIVDLTNSDDLKGLSIAPTDLDGGWLLLAKARKTPTSWSIARRLIADGVAGAIVPSFAPGATADDRNLVLWRWGPDLPHRVMVHDPSGRLPKNALSWV
jgi:RES domain-containing protein